MSMSDKQYAENLNTGGGSGGASEPSDSFEEVATGLRDAEGNMIYKKSYKDFNAISKGETVTLDTDIKPSTHRLYKVSGFTMNGHGHTFSVEGSNLDGRYNSTVFIDADSLKFKRGSYALDAYYVTVYYTHVPVPRSSAKKTSK